MVVEQYDIPVGYVQGANSGILPAIESAVAGRKVGDRVEITLSARRRLRPARRESGVYGRHRERAAAIQARRR
jgi:hypothetical protein